MAVGSTVYGCDFSQLRICFSTQDVSVGAQTLKPHRRSAQSRGFYSEKKPNNISTKWHLAHETRKGEISDKRMMIVIERKWKKMGMKAVGMQNNPS